jgi:hypothetical protein
LGSKLGEEPMARTSPCTGPWRRRPRVPAAVAGERPLARALQAQVERELDLAAGRRLRLALGALDGDAVGVHARAHLAVHAAQEAVVLALQALLADDDALLDVPEGAAAQLLGRDLGDRPDELGREPLEGVLAHVDLVDRDAREHLAALLDVAPHVRVDVALIRTPA